MTIIEPKGDKNIFCSFIEEFWPQQLPISVGRVEIRYPEDMYPSEELRWATDDEGFFEWREKWDFKYIKKAQLRYLRRTLKKKWNSFDESQTAFEKYMEKRNDR